MKAIKKKYNCKDIEKKVQVFLDNQLSEAEIKLFIEHIDYCLPCDKKVEFELKLKEVIKIKAQEKSIPVSLQNELKKILSNS